jgi:hypothetical protein
MMDKVQKYNSFNTNTPSSESYRNYLDPYCLASTNFTEVISLVSCLLQNSYEENVTLSLNITVVEKSLLDRFFLELFQLLFQIKWITLNDRSSLFCLYTSTSHWENSM